MNHFRTHWLPEFASNWGEWMYGMSCQIAILVLVISLINFALRRKSARLRHCLWLLVLIRLVVPPWFAAPTSLRWWIDDWRAVDLTATRASLPVNPVVAESTPFSSLVDVTIVESVANYRLESWALTLTETLLLLWGTIVVARLCVLMFGWLRVRKWISQAREIADPRVREVFLRAQQHVSLPRPVLLREGDPCSTPMVVGILNPVILLPRTVANTLNDEELESVFVHEMLHVVRGDNWVQVAQAVLSLIYFFHPAVWIANACARSTCEQACDEQTIAALRGRRKSYASAIVKTAATLVHQPRPFAIGMLDSANSTRRRLQLVLDPKLPFRRDGTVARGAISLCMAVVLLPSGARPIPTIEPTASMPSAVKSANTEDSQPAHDAVHSAIGFSDSLGTVENESALGSQTSSGRVVDSVESQPGHELTSGDTQTMLALQSDDYLERMAAYAVLEKEGTVAAVDLLEQAFLNRQGFESAAAKKALDSVWERARVKGFGNNETTVRSPLHLLRTTLTK